MSLAEHLIEQLRAAGDDRQAQAAITAEFMVLSRPEAERAALRDTLDAAAVLRWFDAGLLGRVLGLDDAEADRRFQALKAFPFIEQFRRGEHETRNVHEATRLGWRRRMYRKEPDPLRRLSSRAAAAFAADASPAGRIEWIYHRLCADPERGATDLENLDREWTGTARPEDGDALAAAIRELETTGLAEGRALLWIRLVTGWTRSLRAEDAQLAGTASDLISMAHDLGDLSGKASAQC